MLSMSERPNYITPAGYRKLREEYDALYGGERPQLLETIAWAAANGDRSENADYQYGRRRLREVDRRINFLARRMKEAKVTDPARQEDRSKVWFGATVTLVDEDENQRVLTLVGEDEADAGAGLIILETCAASPSPRAKRNMKWLRSAIRISADPLSDLASRCADQRVADFRIGDLHVAVVVGVAAEPDIGPVRDLLADHAFAGVVPAKGNDRPALAGLEQPWIENLDARAGELALIGLALALPGVAVIGVAAFAAAVMIVVIGAGADGQHHASRQHCYQRALAHRHLRAARHVRSSRR
jgi:transcription elongation factor GreB